MYIGRIVCDDLLDSEVKQIPKDIQLVSFKDYKESKLPTLLVGYQKTKDLIENLSVLNKQISKRLYWTFSPREKRVIYEEDLKTFINKYNKDLFNKLEFINIDPLLYNIKTTDKLLSRLEKFWGSFTYLYGDKLYFYHNNKVYHLDFVLLEFINFDIDKIKDYFNDNFKMIEVDNSIENIEVKYIPYIYSKNANENNSISNIHQT